MKYACIQQHRHEFPLALMCRVLGVSRSGYYAAQRRPPSVREQTDQRLRVEVRTMYRRSRKTYGSPRIHAELRAQGVRCGRKRVERLMRSEQLQAKTHRRARSTTNSNHAHPLAANLLQRRFGVSEIADVNTVWAGDITYILTREGWLYLAIVLDLASRSVVGWAMESTLEQSLVHAALHGGRTSSASIWCHPSLSSWGAIRGRRLSSATDTLRDESKYESQGRLVRQRVVE
ncbi:MAG: Mobile element protein, partial [uncultured Chloroflexia bacterium]